MHTSNVQVWKNFGLHKNNKGHLNKIVAVCANWWHHHTRHYMDDTDPGTEVYPVCSTSVKRHLWRLLYVLLPLDIFHCRRFNMP